MVNSSVLFIQPDDCKDEQLPDEDSDHCWIDVRPDSVRFRGACPMIINEKLALIIAIDRLMVESSFACIFHLFIQNFSGQSSVSMAT